MKIFLSIFLLTITQILNGQLSTEDISFGDLRARSIGPATMSGRVSCLAGVSTAPEIIYVGAASGGIWKSISAGASFKPVFDDHIQSIGDIAIDQLHPDTIWAGTGESWVRNSVSVGDGIYVSKNGGLTWEHKGLPESEHIAKVLVHPKDSKKIFVAVQGRLWGDSDARGVYKSEDFGDTWKKVLYIDESTGAADITISQDNPDILFASMWTHRRSPDFFNSGGAGSGLFKSIDGGDNWTKIEKDLPEGILGRIAVEIAPSNSQIVYAAIECEKKEQKGLYKSVDGGANWSLVNTEFNMTVRPFYFSRLHIDPTNADIVFKGGLNAIVSNDGGEKFRTIESGVHSDIHDIWVNPQNNKHVLLGTDGGVYRSLDGAYLFEHFRNLPLSQFYQISVDNAVPYNVYGGLQDNGSWYAPSRTQYGSIRNSDWKLSFYGDGFYSFRHPENENLIYSESQGGNLSRHNKKNGQTKNIAPIPEGEKEKYRFNWNTPIHLSEHVPDRIYVGAQYLFKSDNMGDKWTRISPDLTTNNPDKQRQAKSGGLSIDNSTAENNTTIYIIEESPLDDQIIWVGTDDGLLHVSKDGGGRWKNVTENIPGLPEGLWVSSIDASRFDPLVAYLTVDGHRSGDQSVYVYKTTDQGATWTSISKGIDGFAHVIKEDLVNPQLLYVGTEYGLFISVDGGLGWKRFYNNLPKVPVHDLALPMHEDDLVVGTHGRGVYILDYLSPLRQLENDVVTSTLHFFENDKAIVKFSSMNQPFTGAGEFVGQNPTDVATISYYMKRRHTNGKMTLEVYDNEGGYITSLSAGKSKGINIVELPLRLKQPKAAPTRNRMALFGAALTPSLNEGRYNVLIKKGKEEYRTEVELLNDPTGEYSPEEIAIQKDISQRLYNLTNDLGYIYYTAEDIHTKLEKYQSEGTLSNDESIINLIKEVSEFKNSLVSLEGDFYVDEGEANIREDISNLALNISQYPGKPSDGQIKKTIELEKRMTRVNDRFVLFVSRLTEENKKLESAGIQPIILKTKDDYLSD